MFVTHREEGQAAGYIFEEIGKIERINRRIAQRDGNLLVYAEGNVFYLHRHNDEDWGG